MLIDEYDVECYTPKSAEPILKKGLNKDSSIRWHRLFVNNGSGHVSMLFRYLISAIYNILILLRSKKDDIIFYNFNNVFSLSLIDRINRLAKRHIIICCHGEMEYLVNAKKHSRLYKRLMIELTCRYFNLRKIPAPGMKFIVFGDVIKNNLRPFVNKMLYDCIYSIDHPVIADAGLSDKRQDDESYIVNIGLVGIINEYKGADKYPFIAECFKDDRRLSFHAIGHFQCNPEPFVKAGIIIPKNISRPLSNEAFKRAVLNLDYILFLYPPDTYRLIASGAILDCIRFNKPVIGVRTDYFEYLFEKFGIFGYLAKDYDELIELLRKTHQLKTHFPFNEIQEKLSIIALTPRLKEIVDGCQ